MPRSIHLESHLTDDDRYGRYRGCADPDPRSRWHFLWVLARGLTAKVIASIEALEDAQAERCVALRTRPDLIRSTTLFHWWPKRIKKRQGPRRE